MTNDQRNNLDFMLSTVEEAFIKHTEDVASYLADLHAAKLIAQKLGVDSSICADLSAVVAMFVDLVDSMTAASAWIQSVQFSLADAAVSDAAPEATDP